MDKEQIKAALRAHEPELKEAGILHLHLHGSVVRGDTGPESDVDLAAQFDRAKVRSMLTQVGIEADLADAEGLKKAIERHFEQEAELVF